MECWDEGPKRDQSITLINRMAEASSTARQRLQAERKAFRDSHPVGFVAVPKRKADGSVDLFTWQCEVPGKAGVSPPLCGPALDVDTNLPCCALYIHRRTGLVLLIS